MPELTVTDLEKSLHFYSELAGFSLRYSRIEPNFAYITLGNAQLMLEEFHESGWQTGELSAPFGRGINFQIEVENLDTLLMRFEKAAWPLFRHLTESRYQVGDQLETQREFLVQDPDGYLLRFCEYMAS